MKKLLGLLLGAVLAAPVPGMAQVRTAPAAPVVPSLGALPAFGPGPAAPELSLSLPEFQAAPALGLALEPAPGPALELQPDSRPQATTLRRLVDHAQTPGQLASGAAARFDGARALAADRFDGVSAEPERRIPPGAVGIEIERAQRPGDLDRLIPRGENSHELIDALKRDFGRLGPLDVWTYRDARGGTFHAVDVSGRPGLVQAWPEFQPHERALVAKILRYTGDVKVMIRERGKTPDLIVNGIPTELKTDMGSFDPQKLLLKANQQVLEFSARHGLSEGQVALDVQRWNAPDRRAALDAAEAFRQATPSVGLENIFVFGGPSMIRLNRGSDDRYREAPPEFPEPGSFGGAVFGEARWGRARGRGATRRIADSELSPEDAAEGMALYEKLKDILHNRKERRRNRKRARSQYEIMTGLWNRFRAERGPDAASAFQPLVDLLLREAKGYPSAVSQGSKPQRKEKRGGRRRGGGRGAFRR